MSAAVLQSVVTEAILWRAFKYDDTSGNFGIVADTQPAGGDFLHIVEWQISGKNKL